MGAVVDRLADARIVGAVTVGHKVLDVLVLMHLVRHEQAGGERVHAGDVRAEQVFGAERGAIDVFKLNLEGNHANLAGHTYQHEIRVARDNGVLGSLDANQGDMLLGWDLDEFPTNLYETTSVMWSPSRPRGDRGAWMR